MNSKQLIQAIGREDGDYLTLSNQWARVTVSRDKCAQHQEPLRWVYTVTGDVILNTGPERLRMRAVDPAFPTLAEAMACAVHSLAEYQKGALR